MTSARQPSSDCRIGPASSWPISLFSVSPSWQVPLMDRDTLATPARLGLTAQHCCPGRHDPSVGAGRPECRLFGLTLHPGGETPHARSVIQGTCYSHYLKIIANHLILSQAESGFCFWFLGFGFFCFRFFFFK